MKKTSTPALLPSTPTLTAFAVAVLAVAATLDLTHVSACTEGEGYYVAYRTPKGWLARTETDPCQRRALYAFEKAAMHAIVFHR